MEKTQRVPESTYRLFWYLTYAYYQNDHLVNYLFSKLKGFLCWFEGLLYKGDWENIELIRPIFIIGPHRSGTTILQQILSMHTDIATTRTYSDILDMAPIISKKYIPLFRKSSLSRIVDNVMVDSDSPQEAQGLIGRYFYRDIVLYNPPRENDIYDYMRKLLFLEGKRRFLWKVPYLTIQVPTIDSLFPDAQFIFIHRDPIACVNSKLKFIKIWQDVAKSSGFIYRSLVGKHDKHEELGLGYFMEQANRTVNLFSTVPDSIAMTEDHLHWIEKALNDLDNLGSADRCCFLEFSALIDEPRVSLGRLFEFLQIPNESDYIISKLEEIGVPLKQPGKEFKYIPEEHLSLIAEMSNKVVHKCIASLDSKNWQVIGALPS